MLSFFQSATKKTHVSTETAGGGHERSKGQGGSGKQPQAETNRNIRKENREVKERNNSQNSKEHQEATKLQSDSEKMARISQFSPSLVQSRRHTLDLQRVGTSAHLTLTSADPDTVCV